MRNAVRSGPLLPARASNQQPASSQCNYGPEDFDGCVRRCCAGRTQGGPRLNDGRVPALPVSLTRCSPPRPPSALPRITLEASNQERGTKEFRPQRPLTQHQTGHHAILLQTPCTIVKLHCAAGTSNGTVSRHPTRHLILATLPIGGVLSSVSGSAYHYIPGMLCLCVCGIPVWSVGKNFVIKSDEKQISSL